MLIVANHEATLVITGLGDVIEPEESIIAIGSGGPYATAAARALFENTKLSAKKIVDRGLSVAADICVFTNHHLTIEELDASTQQ